MKKQLLLLVMILLPLVASADAVEIDGIYYNLVSKGKFAEVTSNPNNYTGEVVIPETVTHEDVIYSVTSIGTKAFSGCSGLTSVTIGNSVTSIGGSAFYGCSGLTSVTIGNSVTGIGGSAFVNCYNLKKVIVSDIAAWYGITFGSFHANPLYYAHHLYSDENTEIKDLFIPNNVTSIGSYAFYGCSGLTSVVIPNNVTSIGGSAFSGCSGLTSVVIPNNVTSISQGAFSGCSGLTSVTIGNSVTSIGNYAFYNCSGLTSVVIPNNVTAIGQRVFENCSGLTSVTIGNSVTSIGNYAFYNCSGLTSVVIPNNVTSISQGAFSGCSSLNSVVIPKNVTSISQSVFENCSGLTSVTIGNSVTSIGNYAFYNCSGLTSVVIPNNVTAIGQSAFYYCSSLTSVTIGSGINSIGSQAFASCPELTDVYCHAINVPNTSSDAFNDSYIDYATLHVPVQSIDAYKAKEPWKSFKATVPLGNYYDFTINVGNNGKVNYNSQAITGSSNTFYVEEGANAELAITPDENYQIAMLTVNGVDAMAQLNNGVLTISNITANTTVAVTFEAIPMPQCSTPTIAMKDGKVHFECETEGVEYNYEILPNGALSGKGNDLDINPSYTVKVYASKDGYQDSDTATLVINGSGGLKGDVNNNGGIDIGDAVTIVNFLVGKTATLSRGTGVTEDMKEPQ